MVKAHSAHVALHSITRMDASFSNIQCSTSPVTQVKIDGPVRARYFDGPVTGSEPILTGTL